MECPSIAALSATDTPFILGAIRKNLLIAADFLDPEQVDQLIESMKPLFPPIPAKEQSTDD